MFSAFKNEKKNGPKIIKNSQKWFTLPECANCKLLLLNKQGRKSGFSFRQISNGLIVDLKTRSASAYHSTFVTLIFFPLSKVQYTVVINQWPPRGGRDALGM